jgi:DNA gyrase subunit B
MHGVGLNVVNALSERLFVETRRDGYLWQQRYSRGTPTSEVIQVRPMNDGESTGTSITFYPDAEIFDEVRKTYDYEFDTIASRCRELAYLLPDLTIHLIDQRQSDSLREETFHFENGLIDYVEYLNRDLTPLHTVIIGTTILQYGNAEPDREIISVEFALQYTDDAHTTRCLFVNTVETPDGGTHQIGLRTGLTRAINTWMQNNSGVENDKAKITDIDVFKGLTAVISVKHPFPQFKSQTEVQLMSPDVTEIVASTVSTVLTNFSQSHYYRGQFRRILEHLQHVELHK